MTQHAEFTSRLSTLSAGWRGLPDKPEETPETTLRALWFAAAGAPRSVARVESDAMPKLSDEQLATLDGLVQRRLAGEPLAHISGRQSFCGLEMLATGDALIPRVETELLARTAIERLREAGTGEVQVMDVCTGSGNVALAIAHYVPKAFVYAADLSEDAVKLARMNAKELKLAERTTFEAGDLFAPFDVTEFYSRFEVVTCNPPYISSGKLANLPEETAAYEPRIAFDGGAFGFEILGRVFTGAARFLKPGGSLCFEVGLGQGKFMADRVRRSGLYETVEEVADGAGATRVVAARTPAAR